MKGLILKEKDNSVDSDRTIAVNTVARQILDAMKKKKGVSRKHYASAAIIEKFEKDYPEITQKILLNDVKIS